MLEWNVVCFSGRYRLVSKDVVGMSRFWIRCLPGWIGVLLLATGFTCGLSQAYSPPPKRIALTFDDAPVMRFYSHPSQWHRQLVIDSLANALGRHRAPATVFVIGDLIRNEEGAALLRHWLGKGVQMGNHSLTHRNFAALTPAQGRNEIDSTSRLLQPFAAAYNRPVRYFRFPFLAEGTTEAERAVWQAHLKAQHLQNARATLTTDDWKYDEQYTRYELAQDWGQRYEVGQAYLAHVKASVAYWDSVAASLYGRNVAHVLMLHANRVNRDYLGQILDHLRQQGYTFISLDEAYRDVLYREPITWAAETGTSFLENIKQTRLMQAKQDSLSGRK
jgi:peptidoglycan/xylan/chitin deacetylase (PgdA/CDA1 family)